MRYLILSPFYFPTSVVPLSDAGDSAHIIIKKGILFHRDKELLTGVIWGLVRAARGATVRKAFVVTTITQTNGLSRFAGTPQPVVETA